MSLQTFISPDPFQLENGQALPQLEIAFETFGKLNDRGDNVIWVCHALTANSNVLDWWQGLFGKDTYYDPENYFIVCANNIASCYGSTGPLSVNPGTKERWFSYFPLVTIKDMASALDLLRKHLQIKKINTLIGGSQGGQIALEWSLYNTNVTQHLILIATNALHSSWGIAFNESQRLAIKADRTYYSNTADAAQKGLSAARSIALLSYRGYSTYSQTQKDDNLNTLGDYASASYQRYQGRKLVERFNAYSYVRLSEAMDSHNVARQRAGTTEEALSLVKASTLVIGITSDILFPVSEQKFLAKYIQGAGFAEIDSSYGHDGFLIETEKIAGIIAGYYAKNKKQQNKFTNQSLKQDTVKWQKN